MFKKERCIMKIVNNSYLIALPKFNKAQNTALVTNSDNNKSIDNELGKIAMINKSQVNFRGKGFDFSKKDLMFLSGLTSAFSLSVTVADKLKNKLAEFLQKNKLKSMDDIAGEENLEIQSDLIENLNEITNFEGRDYFKLMDKVLDRCDPEGDIQYDDSPNTGILEFVMGNEKDEFSDALEICFKNVIRQVKQNDKKCIDAIGAAFEFDNKQQAKLEEIVNKTLEKNHLISLKDLESENMLEVESAMVEDIVDAFELSEDDSIVITTELTNRALSNEPNYQPSISPLDRNLALSARNNGLLSKIAKQNNIGFNDMKTLNNAMKKDAYENGFKSVFDLFNPANDFSEYKNVNQVLNSKNFVSKKIDLLIDLNLTAKNIKQEVNRMAKQEKNDNLNRARVNAFICELDKSYNFSKDDIKKLRKVLLDMKSDLSCPENAGKIAYELSAYLNRENDYAKLVTLIEQVSQKSEDELNTYGFKYCQLLMRK